MGTHEDDEGEYPDAIVCDACNREIPIGEACPGCPSYTATVESATLPTLWLRNGMLAQGAEPRDMRVPPQLAISAAIAAANNGSCGKSRRGVIAYRELPIPHVVARGHNAPPPGFACDGSDACKAACSKVCIHAEQAVLAQEFFGPRFAAQVYLVHVKTVDGELVTSGGPSCWQCSRMIVADSRIAGIWLLHEGGWRLYQPDEFHELTLIECGLPVVRTTR